MLLPATVPADAFSLEYRPEQHLLIGRWLRPVTLAEAQAIYEALLAAALAHDNCRHWLLDIRRRAVGDAALIHWFGEAFTPRLAAAFASPVYIAYFAMITHDEAAANPSLDDNIQQGTILGTHYHYFNQEGDCLAWLAHQL
ncbi:hypothetical protein GO988_17990 [Hymenobacter sp. HMF4947]|uniref:STAS/SEC14 domain-containing protein n=1 Tax=Hymenobacter ginkgonis TaxID=2682976 RepID=A0A7K1TIJ1_9BACT|nr:hypothetical protein [Hymenobacter ginkgonis]MVN78224.1 hypothetical protein [Hymenobacter ginkgonis]